MLKLFVWNNITSIMESALRQRFNVDCVSQCYLTISVVIVIGMVIVLFSKQNSMQNEIHLMMQLSNLELNKYFQWDTVAWYVQYTSTCSQWHGYMSINKQQLFLHRESNSVSVNMSHDSLQIAYSLIFQYNYFLPPLLCIYP